MNPKAEPPEETPQNCKEYVADRFSFLYPEDWGLYVPDSGKGVFIHKLPSAFIRVSEIPYNKFCCSIEEGIERLEKGVYGLKLISARNLSVQGMKAKEIQYSFNENYLVGERTMVISSLLMEREDSVFQIDYQSLEEKQDEFLHVYGKVKDSLRFFD
ncbi:MAG: hypothetical protein KAU03_02700 [Candidatus Altiarchaeales archaeon]|nr:hypothetical protein [Candidatus Altiarchaeales archaeon]